MHLLRNAVWLDISRNGKQIFNLSKRSIVILSDFYVSHSIWLCSKKCMTEEFIMSKSRNKIMLNFLFITNTDEIFWTICL